MSDYIDYVGVFSLSILAVSGSYFLDFSNFATALVLLLIPASLGFTAYISRDGFNKASLSAAICLFLAGFNPIVTFIAAVVAVANPLVSALAGGESFNDFFNSVALPLLLTGLIVGGGVYGVAQYDSSVQETVKDTAADVLSSQTETILEATDIVSSTQARQVEAMKNVSRTSILLTEQTVANNMSGELSREQFRKLRTSFDHAEQSIPEKFNATVSDSGSTSERVSEQLESGLRKLIDGRTMIAIVPMLGLLFYSLSPFVGILAGIFGVLWRETLKRAEP